MNNDLISREALKEKLTTTILTADPQYMFDEIMDIIDNAPTVEPEKVLVANVTFDEDKLKEIVQTEVINKIKSGELVLKAERPQGEWKFVFDDKVNDRFIYKCSECGREVSIYSSDALIPVYPFCHCGAEMRKGGAENE